MNRHLYVQCDLINRRADYVYERVRHSINDHVEIMVQNQAWALRLTISERIRTRVYGPVAMVAMADVNPFLTW